VKRQETPSNGGGAEEREQAAQATADTQPTEQTHLTADLEAARKEAAANLEGWQRSMAEFQNYRRRTERDAKDTYQNATSDVLKSLLPIVDDFERALSSLPDDAKTQSWLSGISLIHRKFLKVLEDFNVTPIDPVGESFDPNRHQALGTDEDSDKPSGTITQTLQKGYAVGDRVLRPALVKVAP
jgi:molecular chaperone GrpE